MDFGSANKGDAPEFNEPQKNDYYMFSYTSGTTGDSKGVMLTHNNVLSQAYCSIARLDMFVPGDAIISYLPYPHSYE
jgi:long-chain acyl-CoA synthetase